FGLAGGPSVTSGVISAINRTIESESGLIEDLVQTDASINPGNSGGPLVDVAGKVVAINTAIIPFAQGIGFAIPINSAKACSDEIMIGGTRKSPWLGIFGLTLTRETAHYYRLPVDHGVLVIRIAEGSPAESAGLSEGDIILEISGAQTHKIEDLVDEIREKTVGDVVRILAVRNGRQHFFELTLSEAP
ncbi:MAG: PDZ domain-containing protein, partial [Candidatus Bathyarchaeia archaeon]